MSQNHNPLQLHPEGNDIPFGKTLSTRSMRSIQEEEPVLAPLAILRAYLVAKAVRNFNAMCQKFQSEAKKM